MLSHHQLIDFALRNCHPLDPEGDGFVSLLERPTFAYPRWIQCVVRAPVVPICKTQVVSDNDAGLVLEVLTAQCSLAAVQGLISAVKKHTLPPFHIDSHGQTGRDGELFTLEIGSRFTKTTLDWWTADFPNEHWERLGGIVNEILRLDQGLEYVSSYRYKVVFEQDGGTHNKSWMMDFRQI